MTFKADMHKMKSFLNDKIEGALEKKEFLPIFKSNFLGKDGLYFVCSDYNCANWIRRMVETGITDLNAEAVVLSHDAVVPNVAVEDKVREVISIPAGSPNDYILNSLAQFNSNVDVKAWKITKLILLLKISRICFEQIKAQGGKLNWFLGQVNVEIERQN